MNLFVIMIGAIVVLTAASMSSNGRTVDWWMWSAGIVLVVIGLLYERIRTLKLGPSGVELVIEELKEKTAAAVEPVRPPKSDEATTSDEVTISDELVAEVRSAQSQAAASIRAATSIDELAAAIADAVRANEAIAERVQANEDATKLLAREVRGVKERARQPRSFLNRTGLD